MAVDGKSYEKISEKLTILDISEEIGGIGGRMAHKGSP
jgi:hypothetical protein